MATLITGPLDDRSEMSKHVAFCHYISVLQIDRTVFRVYIKIHASLACP